MTYTIENIAQIFSASSRLYDPHAIIEQPAIDSRRISFPESTVFFALQTSRRDAHVFVKEVYERGVRNFIVKTGFDITNYDDANFVFVDNTLTALQKLAAYHRALFNYPVIGITGSNGKTMVKEWLYQLLADNYNIVRSPRSYNSQVGVPLSVWQMSEENTLAIFEAGISRTGEMEVLANIIRPTIGIFTNLGEAHKENFKNNAEKAAEKAKLFQNTSVIIYPSDDAIIKQALGQNSTTSALFGWGRDEHATLKIVDIYKKNLQTQITFEYKDQRSFILIPFTDEASVQNTITCLCVLLYLELPVETIQQRMQLLHAVSMRLQLVHAVNNCVVVNDTYSFDINSFSVALDFLMQQQQYTQRTVIVSDIPSSNGENSYALLADMLAEKNINRVITIGEQWNVYRSLLIHKIPATEHYQNTKFFIEHFSANHFRSEAILLKGARTFGFEKIVALLERKVHQTVLEINLNAIVHNLNEYRSRLQKGVKVMAMVKALAYGSGSAEIASLLQFHKVDYLAVAYADEGVELRNAGISLPIMVMNVDEAAFETIIQHNLEPELFSFKIFQSFHAFLKEEGLKRYPVHIKLDTGMHRLGFEAKDIPALLPLLQNQQMVLQSAFSHLAASEDKAEDAFTDQQAAIFGHCCNQIREALNYHFIMHISNSAAIFRKPALHYDMVRLGIGLYGVDSSNEHQLSLQKAATLKTTVAQLRNVAAGETIGYNRLGKVTRDSIIATIRIGYADGFSRRLSNGTGKVFVNGVYAPVIGNVAMDMTMVDVTDVPGIKEDDEVEIFGSHIPVQQVAQWCNTIPYEILTGINQRVKRVYVEE